jgi:ubiquitin carboxyl-terminal hydrolase 36/42
MMASKVSDLDRKILTRSQSLIPRRIQFVPARNAQSGFIPPNNKYPPINQSYLDEFEKNSKCHSSVKGENGSGEFVPKVAELKVPLKWSDSSIGAGGGLKNLGLTCFLNATLQCLVHTPPLVNLMRLNLHSPNCRACGFCVYCTLEKHINSVFYNGFHRGSGSVAPYPFVKNLKAISPSLRPGRQEDAHEFLRFVISGLQSKEIPKSGAKEVKPSESDIFSIFGGYLRSEVHCFSCKNSSFTYEQFLDLSLEIANLNTLEQCLDHFTSQEILEKRNAYSCETCKKHTKASKRFTIHTPPSVLVVQLKRFELKPSRMSIHWQKIKKHIKYPSVLDIGPYLSSHPQNNHKKGENQNPPSCKYKLYGVLIHEGIAMNSGHYYSYIKGPNNCWYIADDDHRLKYPLAINP